MKIFRKFYALVLRIGKRTTPTTLILHKKPESFVTYVENLLEKENVPIISGKQILTFLQDNKVRIWQGYSYTDKLNNLSIHLDSEGKMNLIRQAAANYVKKKAA